MLNYERLDEVVEDNSNAIARNSKQDSETGFTVRVLFKEKHYEFNVDLNFTVGALKKLIASGISDALVELQRLIFNGKMLNDDDRTLDSYGIRDKSVIHLFPRSVAVAINPALVGENVQPLDSNNALRSFDFSMNNPGSRSILGQTHLEMILLRHSREIRIFSYMLFIISIVRSIGLIGMVLSGTVYIYCRDYIPSVSNMKSLIPYFFFIVFKEVLV